MCHSVSDCRSNRAISIASILNVDHALRAPLPGWLSSNCEIGASGTFYLCPKLVSIKVNRFAPGFSRQVVTTDMHLELREKHFASRHLVYQRIQPLDQQKFIVWSAARDFYRFDGGHFLGLRHDRGQCNGCLLKGFRFGVPESANRNIGAVRQMFPMRGTHGQSTWARVCDFGFIVVDAMMSSDCID